ncbi:MOXD1 family protein [Megaselia abdita]
MGFKTKKIVLFLFCLPIMLALPTHVQNKKDYSFISVENWEHFMIMDGNGLYFFEWRTDSKDIHFRVTVNTQGSIGLGFSKRTGYFMDFLVIWVDDHSGKPHILDCHTNDNAKDLIQDDTQNYIVINGFQNVTHTQVEFHREMETCDPHDLNLGTDTIVVSWAFDEKDPINGNLRYPSKTKGSEPINFLSPLIRKPSKSNQWDVLIKNITIESNMDTLYWCKIFKMPNLTEKHHIIGYEPLLTKVKNGNSLVHHMTLYECSPNSYLGSDPSSWDVWVKSNGAICNSNSLTPRDWDSCITPVSTWSIGATGQFLPPHVGIPIGGDKTGNYYMLEIHYDNPQGIKSHDRSGLRIHYTEKLRVNDGGIMIAGVSISDTQLIPPGQKLYRNVGICGPSCTNVMFPDSGINILSATTHTHKAGRKMMLRHIRNGKEMDKIIEDDNYNYKYQQIRQLINETLIMPGDYIIAECAYETTNRKRLTFGGYSTKQEMCLSFLTYYPRTQLTGCYSMTPVREFFETFGVYQFYSLNMNDVENLFLYNGNAMDLLPNSIVGKSDMNKFNSSKSKISQVYADGEDLLYQESLLNKLIISDPIEFHDRTFLSHLNQLPWSEPLFTKRVEQIMITGKHMTFCRVSNDSISIPSEIIRYPNYTTYHKPPGLCPYHFLRDNSGCVSINKINKYLMISLFQLTIAKLLI